MLRKILCAALLIVAPASAAPQTEKLLSTDKTVTGQPIVSPDHPTVLATMLTFQPGDKTVVHKHAYPHYGYMLEGVLTLTNVETGKVFEIKAGEFLVEMQNTAHYGENRGKVPVKILIVDSVPEGVTSNAVPVQP
ncbi:quercetin dioxygenase-like cupin family protein [Rhizomicrobium palustre]|uniref:Quercetin dioxygenase-like cupin family protein n=1 Tax=Rhizomicrobium palustre TaxID=189966 RepID=A0A846MZU5_9PROT|nr:cupin domain-containing protein [Rhizomicrobium palustre]NIK88532.1 quercetin dioxygenase-like cupin family protein [Rhizomicrobium palustre]